MNDRDPVDVFIERLPKAELHCHLEGSIPPSLLLEFADRNGVDLPYSTVSAVREALDFEDLPAFIDFFNRATSVLQQPADFTDLVLAIAELSATQNIRYRELTFSFGYYDDSVDWDDVIAGLAAGRRRAAEEYGVEINFVAGIVRTNGPEQTSAVVERANDSRDRAGITTIGMGGKEGGHPAHRHEPAYWRARELAFHRIAHAGEAVGPSSVWDALCSLGIERIDHGVRAIEDDILLEYLAEEEIPLTVCPVSNVELNIYEEMADHPICALMEAGVPVSINADDPALFRATLVDNYREVASAFDLGPADIKRLARNSFEHSFLPEQERRDYLQELDRVSAQLRSDLSVE
jgi:adenosine deaminase